MTKGLWTVAWSLLSAGALLAEPPQPAAVATKPGSVEERLQEPAQLELGDADTITIEELLQQIESRHGISVQFHRDVAILLGLSIMEEGSGLIPGPEATEEPVDVKSTPLTLPTPGYLPGDVQYPDAAPEKLESLDEASESILQPLPATDAAVAPAAKPESAAGGYGQPLPARPVSKAEPITTSAEEGLQPTPLETTEQDNFLAEFEGVHTIGAMQQHFLRTKIVTAPLRNPKLTVEQTLRRVISQMATPFDQMEEMMGMPVSWSHAYDWDLLVLDDTVFIATRMQANLHKVARVYRLPKDSELTPDEVAEVVRKTIRPWSWRKQIDDVVNIVEINVPPGLQFPKQLAAIKRINLTGEGNLIELASETEVVEESAESSSEASEESAEPRDPATEMLAMQALGSLLSSGTRATLHAALNSAEVLHYADPPTATVEVLPGMLIISQSPGAHREIADLLEQITGTAKETSQP